MLDFDLAEIYGCETSKLNQQVKRNAGKFPNDFMFQITKDEFKTIMMSQNVISRWGGTRKLPNAFTETGIYMSITVLKAFGFRRDVCTDQLMFIDKVVDYKHWFFGHYHFDRNISDKKTCLYNNVIELR